MVDDGFAAQTLDELIARLAQQEIVSGILLMGTTGTPALGPSSDYDLLLVFSVLPVPLRMVTTWVDGRLTEVYCTTSHAVDRIATSADAWPVESEEGTLAAWLRDGRIVHDRYRQLDAAQERVRHGLPLAPATDREIAEARRKIAYNVAQLKRYLAAAEPAWQMVVDLRLLYSVIEVAVHYFTVRRLSWRGEKAAVRYWAEHDPAFLGVLRRCLAAHDRQLKAVLYQELAQRTLAPVGGLPKSEEPLIAIGVGWGAGAEAEPSGTISEALRFWQQLITADAD
jgi:hypothetical protein